MSRSLSRNLTKSAEIFRLGSSRFDGRTSTLFNAAGEEVPLRAQSARVLAALCRCPNKTVSKKSLLDEVWGSRSVSEDSLVQCIGDIRRALGEVDRTAVQTVERQGYKVRIDETGGGNRRYLIAFAAVIVLAIGSALFLRQMSLGPDVTLRAADPLSRGPSIAVLPFSNLSDGQVQEYFSDGLSEDLTTELSRMSGLTVISTSSSFLYRDSALPLDRIAAELGAEYVLRGSVRRSGERVRINANLVDRTGVNVWADRIDGDMSDIFRLQDEVTRAIIGALSVSLTETEEDLLQRSYSVDPDAYDLLLRGLGPLRSLTAEGLVTARSYFQRAAEIDPGYARAYAALALSYGQSIVFRLSDGMDDDTAAGLAYSEIALRLDETLPQTHFSRAVLLLASRKHAAAVAAAQRAVELDRSYADGYAVLAQTSAYDGKLEEALRAINIAKKLNPRYTFAYLWVEGHILYQLRRYSEALPVLEDVVQRNPSFYVGMLTLIATYGQLGMLEEAEWLKEELAVVSAGLSATKEGSKAPYRRESDRQHLIDGLLRAGLPK